MWTSVNGSNGPLRTRSKTMRDAAQHVAAQELAVDVAELRVRADRAGAGHAVRLQEIPGQGSLKTYSGTRQPGATAKRAQYRRGNAPGSHNALCLVCWSFAYSALASFEWRKR